MNTVIHDLGQSSGAVENKKKLEELVEINLKIFLEKFNVEKPGIYLINVYISI